MTVSMAALARMTFYAFLLGIALGAVYDLFRITRVMLGVSYGGRSAEHLYSREYPLIGKLKRKSGGLKKGLLSVFVAVGDILFSVLAALSFSVFIYYTNDGIFRFQALLALVGGFILYYKTVGALVISFAEIICIFLKIIAKIFVYAIAIPLGIMYNILVRLLKRFFGVPLAWLSRKVRLILTERKMKLLMHEASFGFLQKYLKGQGG